MNPAELTEFNCVPNLIETEFNRESTVLGKCVSACRYR